MGHKYVPKVIKVLGTSAVLPIGNAINANEEIGRVV